MGKIAIMKIIFMKKNSLKIFLYYECLQIILHFKLGIASKVNKKCTVFNQCLIDKEEKSFVAHSLCDSFKPYGNIVKKSSYFVIKTVSKTVNKNCE